MRRRSRARRSATGGALAALLMLIGPASGAGTGHTEAAMFRFADGLPVAGSAARLVTNDAGATLSLRTSDLDPAAYTVWWVVFNHPEECTDAFADGYECGLGDLSSSAVDASVLFAAGHVVGESGRAGFGGRLHTGDDSRAEFGPGLVNPRGAEIHVVVRTHGPVIPHLVSEQTHTVDGGCEPGQPNDGMCDDVQFAAFSQRL